MINFIRKLIFPKYIVCGITRDFMIDDSEMGDDYLIIDNNHMSFSETKDNATIFKTLTTAKEAVKNYQTNYGKIDPLFNVMYIKV